MSSEIVNNPLNNTETRISNVPLNNDSSCAHCGASASLTCAKCKKIKYCRKECQVAQWRTHKKTCRSEEENAAFAKKKQEICETFIVHANSRISGNIFILASHRYSKVGSGIVVVEITETMEEFIKPGSFHFAHLNFVPEDSIPDLIQKHNLDPTRLPTIEDLRTDSSCVYVVYRLIDHYVVMKVIPEIQIDLRNLKDNHPNPEDDWSVLFTL